jgi:hypothetical protein
MKTLRHLLSLLAGSLTVVVAAATKDIEVIEFTHMFRNTDGTYERSYEYAYGDWGDNKVVQVNGKGLLVNLLGSKGGIGENRGLDFRKHTKARIAFMIGNRNRASGFAFSLEDKDGTNHAFDIPLTGKPVGQLLAATLDLTKPSREEQAGSKPGLDLKKLRVWQLKGNFQSEPLEILVLKVLAVTE